MSSFDTDLPSPFSTTLNSSKSQSQSQSQSQPPLPASSPVSSPINLIYDSEQFKDVQLDSRYPNQDSSSLQATDIIPHSAARPAGNVLTQTLYFIREHTLAFHGKKKVLKVAGTDFRAFLQELEDPQILKRKEVDSLSYEYDPETCLLSLRCMPSSVHNGVVAFAIALNKEMEKSGFLTSVESQYIEIDSGSDVPLPSPEKAPTTTSVKQADASYVFTQPIGGVWRVSPFPRVIFEIAFSQTYSDIMKDTMEWLTRSRGEIKLVILIFLDEGNRLIKNDDRGIKENSTADVHNTAKQRVNNTQSQEEQGDDVARMHAGRNDTEGGNTTRPLGHPTADVEKSVQAQGSDDEIPSSPSYSSQKSAVSEYLRFAENCDSSEYIGPLSGYIELYRYKPKTNSIHQDGCRTDIFPNDISSPANDPRISIRDLLPDRHIIGDKERIFAISLSTLRRIIWSRVPNLALRRMAQVNKDRGKRKFDGSGEYVTSGVEGVEGESERPKRVCRSRR